MAKVVAYGTGLSLACSRLLDSRGRAKSVGASKEKTREWGGGGGEKGEGRNAPPLHPPDTFGFLSLVPTI